MKTRKPFLLRIDPQLLQELEAWAQQDMRSLNGQIEYLLKEALLKRRKYLELKLDDDGQGAAGIESTPSDSQK